MTKEVIYLSYTGMMEPLGQSQVVNYIKSLSNEYKFYLVSLEKPNDFSNHSLVYETRTQFDQFNITWFPLCYKYGIFGHINNYFNAAYTMFKILNKYDIKLIHCRSYMPAIIVYFLQKVFIKSSHIPYIFDTRGFWIDEKADIGEWSRNSINYRLLKRLEKKLFLRSKHIVMLSEKSVKIIQENGLFPEGNKIKNISCITTCTDVNLFKPDLNKVRIANRIKPLIVGYIGNVLSWYDFDLTVRVVKKIAETHPIEFRIYNMGQHDYIETTLKRHQLSAKVETIPFQIIPDKIKEFDLAVFFIKPYFSKQASAATKLGELMATGVPVITNGNVGDHKEIIENHQTGWILESNEIEETDFENIINNIVNNRTSLNCRKLAESYFSLHEGVKKYREIYQNCSL